MLSKADHECRRRHPIGDTHRPPEISPIHRRNVIPAAHAWLRFNGIVSANFVVNKSRNPMQSGRTPQIKPPAAVNIPQRPSPNRFALPRVARTTELKFREAAGTSFLLGYSPA